MASDNDFNIKKIDQTYGFAERDTQGKKKKKKKKEVPEDEAKDHLRDLALSVERVNGLLEEKGSPNRFNLIQKDNEVFIHLIIKDKSGNQKKIKENITHQEFMKIIEQIEKLDGFLVDYTV